MPGNFPKRFLSVNRVRLCGKKEVASIYTRPLHVEKRQAKLTEELGKMHAQRPNEASKGQFYLLMKQLRIIEQQQSGIQLMMALVFDSLLSSKQSVEFSFEYSLDLPIECEIKKFLEALEPYGIESQWIVKEFDADIGRSLGLRLSFPPLIIFPGRDENGYSPMLKTLISSALCQRANEAKELRNAELPSDLDCSWQSNKN